MPDLSRDDIKDLIDYLEENTEMDYREHKRLVHYRGAPVKGTIDTKRERKFGRRIRRQEQEEYFEMLKEASGISGRAREQFEYLTHPRRIASTMRKVERWKKEQERAEEPQPESEASEAASGPEGEYGADAEEATGGSKPAQKGFLGRFFNM